jgi:hypothetical protein
MRGYPKTIIDQSPCVGKPAPLLKRNRQGAKDAKGKQIKSNCNREDAKA